MLPLGAAPRAALLRRRAHRIGRPPAAREPPACRLPMRQGRPCRCTVADCASRCAGSQQRGGDVWRFQPRRRLAVAFAHSECNWTLICRQCLSSRLGEAAALAAEPAEAKPLSCVSLFSPMASCKILHCQTCSCLHRTSWCTQYIRRELARDCSCNTRCGQLPPVRCRSRSTRQTLPPTANVLTNCCAAARRAGHTNEIGRAHV